MRCRRFAEPGYKLLLRRFHTIHENDIYIRLRAGTTFSVDSPRYNTAAAECSHSTAAGRVGWPRAARPYSTLRLRAYG